MSSKFLILTTANTPNEDEKYTEKKLNPENFPDLTK
jgi:hypothetical protein